VRRHPQPSRPAAPPAGDSLQAAVQPLLEHVAGTGQVEQGWIDRAWELYETPEVRFTARQYSNAFASAKMMIGRREVLGKDPVPILEPSNAAESKAVELMQTFAGGPEGQVEFLDRMGTYFMVPGDMIAVGALDPARMAESRFAKWDLWSTTEVRWDGQKVHLQTSPVQDRFQEMPEYIKHIRIWNRHPRRGWESDSPVRAALKVLELIGLYDDRLAAEAISRLVGAGVWMIPQGMSLPTSTGEGNGTQEDFIRLLMDVAKLAIADRRSPAANVPILVEAAAEDILAAKEGLISFSTDFAERIGELQEMAIRRWATGADIPAEVILGLSSATHWNSSLISEDKVQSFIIPSLRRCVGNLTYGWLHPALKQFDLEDPNLVVWFDPAGIKTRVDLAEEAQWAKDRFMVSTDDVKDATGLHQTTAPDDEDLRRQMLLHLAKELPEYVPDVLRELGINSDLPGVESGIDPVKRRRGSIKNTEAEEAAKGSSDGRQGPHPGRDADVAPASPGRTARLSTKE
jgi:hypothetical protein